MAIKIVTDSVSDLPAHIISQYDITVLPLLVNFENASYRDGVDLTSEEFFVKLRDAKKLPTTSQVNPGEFIKAFEEILSEGHEIIAILMGSQMSGTYNAAVSAVEYLSTDRISVIDSKAISFGYGLLVIEAARRAGKGEDRKDIVEAVEMASLKLVNLFVVDTLEYLQKGGRLSAGEAMIGNLLNIKPILTIEEGRLKSLDKVRGRKKAIKWMIEHIRTKGYNWSELTVGFFHADDAEEMEVLVQTVCEALGQPREIIKSHVGTVVGTHSGPGCLAISFIAE